ARRGRPPARRRALLLRAVRSFAVVRDGLAPPAQEERARAEDEHGADDADDDAGVGAALLGRGGGLDGFQRVERPEAARAVQDAVLLGHGRDARDPVLAVALKVVRVVDRDDWGVGVEALLHLLDEVGPLAAVELLELLL